MKLVTNTIPWLKEKHLLFRLRRNVRPIFVLSTGRCGTKLLTHLLNESQDALVTHEPSPRFLSETKAVYQANGATAYTEHVVREYAKARWQLLYESVCRRQVYIECSNRLTYLAYGLKEYFPHARFIHLYRNPWDVVRSGMRRKYYTGVHLWDKYRIVPREYEMSANQWDECTAFEKTCWYWATVNEWILTFLEFASPYNNYSLKAEDLFSDPLNEINHLCDWLKIGKPESERVLDVARTRVNAQLEGDFPHWSKWGEDECETVSKLTGSVARKLGYLELTTNLPIRRALLTRT